MIKTYNYLYPNSYKTQDQRQEGALNDMNRLREASMQDLINGLAPGTYVQAVPYTPFQLKDQFEDPFAPKDQQTLKQRMISLPMQRVKAIITQE